MESVSGCSSHHFDCLQLGNTEEHDALKYGWQVQLSTVVNLEKQ
jgi:hypothetical protein